MQRSEITPIIYDYRDIKIDYLNKMFLKRNTYYRKIDKQATLFDDPVEEVSYSKSNFIIDKKIKISFEALEFRYGSIVIKYNIPELNIELEFDIKNSEIRPEFEVLKSYFSKTLSMKNVTINIYAEFENGKLISQLATSEDVEKINREIIESVKFKFINRNFMSKTMVDQLGNLLDISQLQINGERKNNLYDSGEDLLCDVLKIRIINTTKT